MSGPCPMFMTVAPLRSPQPQKAVLEDSSPVYGGLETRRGKNTKKAENETEETHKGENAASTENNEFHCYCLKVASGWTVCPKFSKGLFSLGIRRSPRTRDITSFLFSSHAHPCVRDPDHQHSNPNQDDCLPEKMTFLASIPTEALCFSVLTVMVLGVSVKHGDVPEVKANNQTLSSTLLTSLILCFLCSLLFTGSPNTSTCILQQTTFAAVLAVAISIVLSKTMTAVLAFKTTIPGERRQWLISGAPNSVISSVS
ncbi:hypothetical protein HPG69_012869 [Diceros bicornis minor]|uniref:G-protein coupled receptors family 3 profile domain-containing protein n=1 Tax=Diceros bicornis minor TaxID=77932 RepID=A0A7J7F1D1_DICBM|nr:hypothetical protein HPG69_012869 [Diceros bicornis minor]